MKIIPLLLALGLAVGGVVAPILPAAPDISAVDIVAAPALSGVLRPNQSLLVSGTITNRTGQSLDAVSATLYVSSTRMVTRSAVAKWLAEEAPAVDSHRGAALGETKLPELGVGQTRSFSLSVPAASLAFMSGPMGAFGLEVYATSGGVALATQHSTVSWFPEGPVPRVNLAVAMPLDAPPSLSGILDAETLGALTSPLGGDLYNQLQMTRLHSVAIGVDPMIVASIRLLGDNAPQSARDWLQELDNAPNDVFSLSYADSDQLLLHRAGAKKPLAPISFPDAQNVAPVPVDTTTQTGSSTAPGGDPNAVPVPGDPVAIRTTIDALAWPARALESESDLDYLQSGGSTRTLLSSSDVAGSALFTPNVSVGKHQVTVSDDQISALLRAAADAKTDGEWASVAANLTATLAVTASQSPGSTVVATFDRQLSPNSRLMGNTLGGVESLPWVNSTSLSNALNAAPVNGSISEKTAGDDSDADRIPLTKQLLSSELDVEQFSSVADDPTLVTGPQRLQVLALASATWAANGAGWEVAISEHAATNVELLNSVHIPEGTSILFPLEKGNLPIAVRNELAFPVTVYVTVRADRPIINVVDKRVALTLEPNSQAKVSIPIESIANGEVSTTVSLSSATGVPIATPTTVNLIVQAGWETTATVVLAVILLGLFAAGIWRTIVRRRSSRLPKNVSKQEQE